MNSGASVRGAGDGRFQIARPTRVLSTLKESLNLHSFFQWSQISTNILQLPADPRVSVSGLGSSLKIMCLLFQPFSPFLPFDITFRDLFSKRADPGCQRFCFLFIRLVRALRD